jgi:hypothetical protein
MSDESRQLRAGAVQWSQQLRTERRMQVILWRTVTWSRKRRRTFVVSGPAAPLVS